jgi:hypothetical protein
VRVRVRARLHKIAETMSSMLTFITSVLEDTSLHATCLLNLKGKLSGVQWLGLLIRILQISDSTFGPEAGCPDIKCFVVLPTPFKRILG